MIRLAFRLFFFLSLDSISIITITYFIFAINHSILHVPFDSILIINAFVSSGYIYIGTFLHEIHVIRSKKANKIYSPVEWTEEEVYNKLRIYQAQRKERY